MANKFGFVDSLEYVLREMCRRVGENFDRIDFSNNLWYTKRGWSEEEYEDFKEWLANYLNKNRKASKEITGYHYCNKTTAKKTADWFGFQYGWKFSDKTKIIKEILK